MKGEQDQFESLTIDNKNEEIIQSKIKHIKNFLRYKNKIKICFFPSSKCLI